MNCGRAEGSSGDERWNQNQKLSTQETALVHVLRYRTSSIINGSSWRPWLVTLGSPTLLLRRALVYVSDFIQTTVRHHDAPRVEAVVQEKSYPPRANWSLVRTASATIHLGSAAWITV